MNQCFVIATNSANDDMAKSSGIISPFGVEYRDDSKEVLSKELDLKELQDHCREYLAGYKLPRELVLTTFKRTPNGKTNK